VTRSYKPIGIAVIALSYWALLLFVSLSSVHTPDALQVLLTAGLPLFGLAGFQLWRTARAADLAFTDELTGLSNRRAFLRDASQLMTEQVESEKLGLIVFDVDGLKALNDSCGHPAGDELLRHVAQHLARAHTSVYRVGGDEFALLVARSRGDHVTTVLRELEPFRVNFSSCGHVHTVSTSFGYASSHGDEPFEALFRRADDRLRLLKQRLYAEQPPTVEAPAQPLVLSSHPDIDIDLQPIAAAASIHSLSERRARTRHNI